MGTGDVGTGGFGGGRATTGDGGRTDDGRRGHHARRPAGRTGLVARAARQGLHPDRSTERRGGNRTDRGPDRIQPGHPLHGCHRLRFRARQVAGLPAAPRRVPAVRRPLHVAHRHVPGRALRLFLRDEPVGPDGRRGVRRQRDEPRLGWHLERTGPPQRHRLDDRNRDSVPHAELRPRQRHMGYQLPAHGPPEERGQHLDGVGAQPGPRSHDQRRPGHRNQRSQPGRRTRREAVRPFRHRPGCGPT